MRFVSNYTRTLVVAAQGCSHIPADTASGRSSMSVALANYESTKLSKLDLIIDMGDYSANQDPSEIASYSTEGADCQTQLASGTNKAIRSKIYTMRGNHDAGDSQNNWYNTYIGNNQGTPPYPFIVNTPNYRAFATGNVLWLILDDINHLPQPCGRSGGSGGFPSMATSLTAYNWWVSMIESNPTKIIITCSHSSLNDTTIATGLGEGVSGGFHGSSGDSQGTSQIYYVLTNDAGTTYETNQTRFQDYLVAHPGAVTLWLSAHTHHDVGETYGGKGYYSNSSGCTFVNVGNLSLHHGVSRDTQSKILTFTEGSNILRMINFLHDTGYQNLGYNGNPVSITLPRAFQL